MRPVVGSLNGGTGNHPCQSVVLRCVHLADGRPVDALCFSSEQLQRMYTEKEQRIVHRMLRYAEQDGMCIGRLRGAFVYYFDFIFPQMTVGTIRRPLPLLPPPPRPQVNASPMTTSPVTHRHRPVITGSHIGTKPLCSNIYQSLTLCDAVTHSRQHPEGPTSSSRVSVLLPIVCCVWVGGGFGGQCWIML